MTKRVPPTNWLFGNLNIGGVLKSRRSRTDL